jgi:hypothetical protein
MTITITTVADVPNDSNPHQTNATGSVTPPASSRVIIFSHGNYDGGATYLDSSIATTITGWTTSPTRTGRSADLAIGFDPIMNIFEGVMGASPTAGTMTIDWHTNTDGAYGCFQVIALTGTIAIPTHKQTMAGPKAEDDGGGNSETHTTSSLGSAATNGNLCIVAFGAQHDGVVASATPAGWTAVGTPQSANYAQIGIWSRTDFTGTSVTNTDLGTLVDSSTSVLMEFEEVGAGGAAANTKQLINPFRTPYLTMGG